MIIDSSVIDVVQTVLSKDSTKLKRTNNALNPFAIRQVIFIIAPIIFV